MWIYGLSAINPHCKNYFVEHFFISRTQSRQVNFAVLLNFLVVLDVLFAAVFVETCYSILEHLSFLSDRPFLKVPVTFMSADICCDCCKTVVHDSRQQTEATLIYGDGFHISFAFSVK